MSFISSNSSSSMAVASLSSLSPSLIVVGLLLYLPRHYVIIHTNLNSACLLQVFNF